ncbi:MAG TPA: hypothetical protein ENJ05_10670 [Thiotrichales bacterium]|nr:hypothetical protein [Thiotrichales bacterium]
MQKVFLAFFLGMVLVQPALAVRLPHVLLEHIDDETLSLAVDDKELEGGPAWQPGEGPLPLNPDRLIVILNGWAKKHYPQFQSIAIQEIVLKPIESPAYGSRWHYLVAFRGVVDGKVQHDRIYVAVVLFNGKVIPATVEPHL